MAAITLFRLPQVVTLVMAINPTGANMITSFHHTRSDFKLFWNVRNEVEFLVKDFDKQTLSLSLTSSFAILITNPRNGEVLLRKPLDVVSSPRGHLRLVLSSAEVINLPIGHLNYSVVVTDNGSDTLLYTDRDHHPQARLEVTYGPVPEALPPLIIERAAFLPVSGMKVAGAYKGPAQTGGDGVQTIQLTGEGYSGQFILEGSLETALPTVDEEWFVVDDQAITGLDGNMAIEVDMMLNWVRFKMKEDQGSVERVLYRA